MWAYFSLGQIGTVLQCGSGLYTMCKTRKGQDFRIVARGATPRSPSDVHHNHASLSLMPLMHMYSRACRSSIMVGRPLDAAAMTRVLGGMAALEQPWNCPHGRPTMRHVCVLPLEAGEIIVHCYFSPRQVGRQVHWR